MTSTKNKTGKTSKAASTGTQASAKDASPTMSKGEKRVKRTKPPREKRVSALDAAAKVLVSATKPMTAGDLVEHMLAKKLWSSPKGKTPAATLSAAIGREIKDKGKESRFKKSDRGLFASGPGNA